MAAKKDRYEVLRDCVLPSGPAAAGDVVEVDPDQAALLIRDGMIAPAGADQEG